MSRNQAKLGTRDHCVHCGGVVELTSHRETMRYVYWTHLEPVDPEKPTRCCFEEIEGRSRSSRAAKPRTFCAENVETAWTSNLCNRPVKDPDLFMCGIHANHERKRRKRSQEWDEHYELQSYVREQVSEQIKTLEEDWGLETEMHYQHSWGGGMGSYTGKVIVDPVKLIELLAELSEMESL